VQSLDKTFIDGFNKYLDGIEALVPFIPDSDSAAILADFQTQVDAFGSAVIADVPKGICHVRIPGEEGRSTICTPEETKDQGGGVCNLVGMSFYSFHLSCCFLLLFNITIDYSFRIL
jgi:hypothetical protein